MADLLYLNHAGTSWPKPAPVLEAVQRAFGTPPDGWHALFAEAHATVAAAFGVSEDALLHTPGATQALAVAVADVPFGAGERVLTSGMEHHALVRPLSKLSARGVQVVQLPRGERGPLDLDALDAELEQGSVRLVALSMASNVTGERLPFEEVVRRAHDHGALCLLDGAQVAGWQPLDLAAMEVDLFAFAGHKGPQGPTGVGGLYVRPGLVLDTPGATCDGSVCRTGPGYCDTGSVDLPALCGLAAGLRWMAERRPLAAARRVEEAFRERVETFEGVRVHGVGERMPTCSLTVAGRAPAEVADALAVRGVVVRAGTQCAPRAHATLGTGEEGTVRFSFGPQATQADAVRAAEALQAVL
ncbi:MAG: aminotransferase class V-fold PLP-dependent enzyme [Myxococcales bacterium]|nr:aminotransferase class V-fold PLP-dependent enzyme [Myxococcales bacterium]